MKVAIFTDSNSGITQNEAKEHGVFLVPMPFLIDGEEYFEEISLSQDEFYEKLTNNATVSTSQPSIYEISQSWEECLKEYDEIVYIPMSSGLSGSCQAAIGEAEKYNGRVFVVDNKRISLTQKQSVYDAVKLASEGKTGAEIKDYLIKTSLDASIYITIPTLKYLKKGGRLTPAAALLGSLLQIKPVLQIQGEKLDSFTKVLTVAQGKRKMIEAVIKDIETRFAQLHARNALSVSIAYTNCLDKALDFEKEVNKHLEKYGLKVEYVDPLSLSVSCHIGDGALAIACYSKY